MCEGSKALGERLGEDLMLWGIPRRMQGPHLHPCTGVSWWGGRSKFRGTSLCAPRAEVAKLVPVSKAMKAPYGERSRTCLRNLWALGSSWDDSPSLGIVPRGLGAFAYHYGQILPGSGVHKPSKICSLAFHLLNTRPVCTGSCTHVSKRGCLARPSQCACL